MGQTNKKALVALAILLLVSCTQGAFAQKILVNEIHPDRIEIGARYDIELINGKMVEGRITEILNEYIVVNRKKVKYNIPFSLIKSVEIKYSRQDSTLARLYKHPFPNKYLHGHSAILVKHKQWHYHNHYVFQNSVHVGITNWLELGLGINAMGFSDGNFPLLASLKLGKKLGNHFSISLSASLSAPPETRFLGYNNRLEGLSAIIYSTSNEYDIRYTSLSWASVILPMVQITWGDSDHNLTLGAGVSLPLLKTDTDRAFSFNFLVSSSSIRIPVTFAPTGFTRTRTAIQLSGFTRLDRSFGLILDGIYFFDGQGSRNLMLIPGFRIIGRRISIDAGVMIAGHLVADTDQKLTFEPYFVRTPVVGFNYLFGRGSK